MIRILLQQQKLSLRAKKSSHVRKSRAKYMTDYDTRVHETLMYSPGNFVVVDNPPIRAVQETTEAATSQA